MKKIIFLLFLLMFYVCIHAQKYHDAALFNAPYGSVRYIDYEAGRINFLQDGRIDKKNSTYLSLYKKYNIKYDKQGYPASLTTDNEETKIEYDNKRRISKKTVTGNQNYVVTYQYDDRSVSVTQTSMINGHPQKEEKNYDVVSFDDWGNWTTKGCKGTTITSTQVSYQRLVGSALDLPTYSTSATTIGREKEDRVIAYWNNNTFKPSSSPNEISFRKIFDAFFMNRYKVKPKEVEKYFKKNKIAYKKGKDEYGAHTITKENCDELFYGFPIRNMTGSYYHRSWFGDYSIDVVLDSREQRADFIVFLIEQLNKMQALFKSKDIINGVTFSFDKYGIYEKTMKLSTYQENGKEYICVNFSFMP